MKECVSPRELNHFGQRRSVSSTVSLVPAHSLGNSLRFMDQTAAKALKTGNSTDLNGTAREFRNSLGTLLTIFGAPATYALLARRAVPVVNTTKA